MDDQLDLGGIPEGNKIVDGDDPGVGEPIAEDGEGIADIFF
jgi:hypothetical protein